jgi:hypothetical protein
MRSQCTCAAGNDPVVFYSVAEAAGLYRMSQMTLYRAINALQFPAVRVRGRIVVPALAVRDMAQTAVSTHTLVDAADWVRPSVDGAPPLTPVR